MTQRQTQSNYSRNRLKLLRARIRELKLDALLTLDPANLRWLSAWQEVFDDEPAHLTLVTAKKAYIHTDSRYADALHARNTQGLWQVSPKVTGHFAYVQAVLARTHRQGLRLGYESTLRLDQYKALKKALSKTSVKLVETGRVFEDLRAIKDEEEIRLLRRAQAITDAAFAELLTWVRCGMREQEVANRLDFTLREKGAEDLAFKTIAASGPNAALPHARPTRRRLRTGDFLTLDFGARYRDYCADMTRTLVLGEATDKQRRIYDAVLAAQTQVKAGIRAGMTGKQADESARTVLRAEGLDESFTHSLGHGVGINVHEGPVLSQQNTAPLVAGNVVTVEPGVYLPGYGGVRIEDFGLVGERGFTSFTSSPHALIEVL
ncbi:MAG: Xaa-Pro peptidase family protein [Coriobacteriales bacterium]|jgi:Xaa-Pro aminopeptidase|nr:Xaa-Pro peptidase family protein [Coriobacteriales bacterium]